MGALVTFLQAGLAVLQRAGGGPLAIEDIAERAVALRLLDVVGHSPARAMHRSLTFEARGPARRVAVRAGLAELVRCGLAPGLRRLARPAPEPVPEPVRKRRRQPPHPGERR